VFSRLKRLLSPKAASADDVLPRLGAGTSPGTAYAIGDVHGCLSLLKDLEAQIVKDARDREGESWLVLLGDLVDRGPQSAQVLDHVLAPLPGLRRLCIRGNHEATMLGFLRDPANNTQWLEFGGRETLLSYGIDQKSFAKGEVGRSGLRQILDSYIPAEHIEFLAGLPTLIETPDYVFVHAGLRPGVLISQQTAAIAPKRRGARQGRNRVRLPRHRSGALWRRRVESCWLSLCGAISAMYIFLTKKTFARACLAIALTLVTLLHFSAKESVGLIISVAVLFAGHPRRWLVGGLVAIIAVVGLCVLTPIGDLIGGQLNKFLGDASDPQVRSLLTTQSLHVALDYFPGGSGAGTYASPPSFQLGYSDIYNKYGLSSLWGASAQAPQFLLDVFWPKILAQAGFIGALAYLIFFFKLNGPAFFQYFSTSSADDWFCFSIVMSSAFISVASSPYSHEVLFSIIAFACAYSFAKVRRGRALQNNSA
jgi:serine/threonine protein phosphatase 1